MDNFVLILTEVEFSSDSANDFLFWGEKHIPSRAMFVVPSAGWKSKYFFVDSTFEVIPRLDVSCLYKQTGQASAIFPVQNSDV